MRASQRKSPATPKRKTTAAVPAARHSLLYYRLHALLHTVRTIAEFEDQLCILTHEAKASGSLPKSALTELQEVLTEMPFFEYQHELDGLNAACTALRNSNGTPRRRRNSRPPSVKPSLPGTKRVAKRK